MLVAALAMIAAFTITTASRAGEEGRAARRLQVRLQVQDDPEGRRQGEEGRHDQRAPGQVQGGRDRRGAQVRRPDDPGHGAEEERQVQEGQAEEGRPRGQEREERRPAWPRTASRRIDVNGDHDQEHDGAELRDQRVLHPRLEPDRRRHRGGRSTATTTSSRTRSRRSTAPTASTPSAAPAARCSSRRATATATRRSTSARPRRRTSRRRTLLKNLDAHENVLGVLRDELPLRSRSRRATGTTTASGIVPNTLDSEPFEPTDRWARSRTTTSSGTTSTTSCRTRSVQTISDGLGTIGTAPDEVTIQYPTGIGVALFGATGWEVHEQQRSSATSSGAPRRSRTVRQRGLTTPSRPTTSSVNNEMGRDGTDTNAVDFWIDGSGSGNCFQGNTSSTFDPSRTATTESLYPTCPAPAPPASGTGSASVGDVDQVGELPAT